MFTTHRSISIRQVLSVALALALTVGLVVGLVARPAGATSLASVSSNVAEAADGTADFTMKVRAHNSGDLAALEVDHSVTGLPEFTVYADEADPTQGQQAAFAALGVTVSYNAALSEWTFVFAQAGGAWGQMQTEENMRFYCVLRGSDNAILWGSMDTVTNDNTFSFDFVEGTGSELVYEAPDEEEDAPAADADTAPAGVVVPGVPNTSTVN